MNEPSVAARYRLEQMIATVDAANGMATLDQHQEAIKQAAVADCLLITKTDLVDAALTAKLRARLAALNPAASQIDVIAGKVDPDRLFSGDAFDPSGKSHEVQEWLKIDAYQDDHAHHDDRIRSYSVIRDAPISWPRFQQWLDMVSRLKGDDLLRVKGIVNVLEHPLQPVVIHGVQHIFHPPRVLDRWPSADHRTRLVFITRNIDRDVIEGTLEVFEHRGRT